MTAFNQATNSIKGKRHLIGVKDVKKKESWCERPLIEHLSEQVHNFIKAQGQWSPYVILKLLSPSLKERQQMFYSPSSFHTLFHTSINHGKVCLMNNLGKYPIYLTACSTSNMHKISHGDIFFLTLTITSPVSFIR